MNQDIDNSTKAFIIKANGLSKNQKDLLEYCKKVGWGEFTVIVKGGEPVLAQHIREDTKFGS